MASKKKSYKGGKQYKLYAGENRARKNKIADLKRHLKKYPDDQLAKSALTRLEKDTTWEAKNGRKKPVRNTGRVNTLLPIVNGRIDWQSVPTTLRTEQDVMLVQVKDTLNRACGRLSAFGQTIQKITKFRKKVDNILRFEKERGMKSFAKNETWKLGPCFGSAEDEEFFETNFSHSKAKTSQPRKRKQKSKK